VAPSWAAGKDPRRRATFLPKAVTKGTLADFASMAILATSMATLTLFIEVNACDLKGT
jgi:hypothetical protein